MQKVIITGANGFIGTHLALHLAAVGYDVVALVTPRSPSDALRGQQRITCLDYTFDRLPELHHHPALLGATTLYHLAWAGVSTACKDDAHLQAANVRYALLTLDLAHALHVPRVVMPGSASEYALGHAVITGHEAPAPSDPYSAAKAATRILCQAYARQLGITFIWAAITSIYGPGRRDSNLITYAIQTLLRGQRPSFTGLQQQWDYLYVDDLTAALRAIGERGRDQRIYPVGSGVSHPLLYYVEAIRRHIDPSLPLGIGDLPYRAPTLDHQVLDISELTADTGFLPHFSFDQGILLTIRYHRQLLAHSPLSPLSSPL